MPTAEGALSGYRVLDLSRGLSGAFCARLFGDQGADVVLLEDAEGHPVRALPPYGDGERGIERSLIHGYANVSKRSVALASESADRASLARRADVVVVSDPDTARRIEGALRPEAVMVGVSAYGLSGAWSELPGNDLTSWSSTSWPLLNGEAGRPPLTGVQHSASCLAAAMAYTGAVAALIRRSERTRHEVVDVSETETLAWLGANGILASAFGEEPAPRSSQAGVFNPPVPVKDGYITISFSRPHFWTEAMRAIGLAEIGDDPRYRTQAGRAEFGSEVAQTIDKRLSSFGRWELFELLSEAGATAGVVADARDLAESEQLRGRGIIQQTEVADQVVEILGAAGRLTATPWRVTRRAPRLGEHTDEVLADWDVSS